jgi:hypothetical protein
MHAFANVYHLSIARSYVNSLIARSDVCGRTDKTTETDEYWNDLDSPEKRLVSGRADIYRLLIMPSRKSLIYHWV